MRNRRAAVVVLAGLAIFVALTALVAAGTADGVDRAVARFAGRHDSSAAVRVAQLVTDVFDPVVDAIILLAGATFLGLRRQVHRPVLVALGVVAAVSLLVLTVKYAVNRPLPRSHGHGANGFPSGHTAATLAFLGTLSLFISDGDLVRRRRLLLAVGAVTSVVVAALVYARFHWLTDTLASVALGVAVVAGLLLARLDRTPHRSLKSGPGSAR
jgi:undecaprenyl-diphosphatase